MPKLASISLMNAWDVVWALIQLADDAVKQKAKREEKRIERELAERQFRAERERKRKERQVIIDRGLARLNAKFEQEVRAIAQRVCGVSIQTVAEPAYRGYVGQENVENWSRVVCSRCCAVTAIPAGAPVTDFNCGSCGEELAENPRLVIDQRFFSPDAIRKEISREITRDAFMRALRISIIGAFAVALAAIAVWFARQIQHS